MTHRSRKLLDIAHDAPCFINLDGCTSDGFVSGECVPCHSDLLHDDRGASHKSHDALAVSGCVSCHAKFNRKYLGRDQYFEVHARALKRYLVWLFENDKLEVA